MRRSNSNSSTAAEPVESDEKIDIEEDDDPEEVTEEEVEYEEVEEEIEEEIEVEVDDEDTENDTNTGRRNSIYADGVVHQEDEDERKKHAELLALPPHGSEVYIGGIPQDVPQEDLKNFCESIGEVTQVRIMKGKDSKGNKGFAFVTFGSAELASRAINELNSSEFKGNRIKCSTSQSKNRLFIRNVPRSWVEEDLWAAVTKIGIGVTSVELVEDTRNSNNNRGFAFVEFYNNACAEYSRQKMMDPKFKLGDNAPNVSWAETRNTESSATSQVKAVYVKNLPKNVTQDQLKKLFDHHGKITKIVLPPPKPGQNRIAFVHFADRSSALKAVENTEKYEVNGQVAECSLAKPQADQKAAGLLNLQPGLLSSYPSNIGHGMVGGSYGALGTGFGVPGFAQPVIYGTGATPTGMAMMPMLLPDGRVGYILQQPGGLPHISPIPQPSNWGGGNNTAFSSRGKQGTDSHRYQPY